MYLFPPKYIALYAKVFLEPFICLIISVLKTFSVLFFSLFFYSNARKSCALFIEFLFPHDIFLQGKILPHSTLPSTPPPNQKNPNTLPNNHCCM